MNSDLKMTRVNNIDNASYEGKIIFEDFDLSLPPQCVFDLPHARAINIFLDAPFMINRIGRIEFTLYGQLDP